MAHILSLKLKTKSSAVVDGASAKRSSAVIKRSAQKTICLIPKRNRHAFAPFSFTPDFARRGIGKLIIEACESAAQSAGFQQLELAATLPGEPMYRAVGYEVIERFELSFSNGIFLPLVRMGKSIK